MMNLHELFPNENWQAGAVLLVALALLTLLTALHFVQQFVILPRIRNELFVLNSQRARQLQEALISAVPAQGQAIPEHPLPYPFTGWLELVPEDGSIRIAGQVFPRGSAFDAVAKDEMFIPRACVTTDGRGDVFILSHGQKFIARYADGQWSVQTTT